VQVPANSTLRFTIYGHAWSTFCIEKDGGLDCNARDSFYGDPNPIPMKVGIDPTGGTQWSSGSIVWSEAKSVYDNWDLFQVEATAQGEFVTVFVYSSPLYPAPVVNVYWDDAALVVTAGGDSQPEEEQPPDTSANNPPAASSGGGGGIGAIPTQAPREDGSQWHVVQSGETLGGIAVAYGITAQDIRDLNSLTSDVVWVGQELLIKPAGSNEPEPQPIEEEAAVEEEQPPAVAEEPQTEQLGAICVLMFEDQNQNGLREEEEGLLANGTMNLSGVMSDSYTSDGVSEPHCFSELASGDYLASAIPPEGYQLTGLAELPVTITGGGQIALNFGAVGGGEATTDEEAEPTEEEAASTSSDGSPIRTILVVAGIVVVALLAVGGGLAAYFLIQKRKATI
jgi:LysM repeat protein